jgi:deazaflavin-dependent oxidoreductase (nitroreductase family)
MPAVLARVRAILAAFFSRVMRTRFAQRRLAPRMARTQMSLYRLTRGRLHLSSLLVPTLILVTTGAKSGLRRETPLMCWPEPGGTFLVAGSNWGQPHHPAWTSNLIAHPEIEIVYKGRSLPVVARQLDGAEREAVWPVLEAQWPRYRDYERAAGRTVRIFRLSPRQAQLS